MGPGGGTAVGPARMATVPAGLLCTLGVGETGSRSTSTLVLFLRSEGHQKTTPPYGFVHLKVEQLSQRVWEVRGLQFQKPRPSKLDSLISALLIFFLTIPRATDGFTTTPRAGDQQLYHVDKSESSLLLNSFFYPFCFVPRPGARGEEPTKYRRCWWL